jgi:Zn-dependent protease/predicted transcriptional regulator
MKWSWRIGRIAGIGVYIHATFWLILAWIAFVQYRAVGTAEAVVNGIVFVIAVFSIVVMHELGHALSARRYGIATRDITLLPIGGIARLERMPRDPRQELVIALAGPAVNFALAAFLWMILLVIGFPAQAAPDLFSARILSREFVLGLLSINIFLGVFNLIPAFPMDGGRVLRALLAMRSNNYAKATEAAARVGRFFALVFGLVGFFVLNNPFLVIIALFVWMGAAAEAAAVQTSAMLEGVPLERVMITDIRTVGPNDPLSRPVQLIIDGFQQDFPVVDEGRVVGVLTRSDLMKGLTEQGAHASVASVMHREFMVAEPGEPVEEALVRLRSCNCHTLPVVYGGELRGVLTLENVGEYVMVQSALRGAHPEGLDGERIR